MTHPSTSSTKPVQLGISTCPNDTFAFHGLMAGEVDLRGLTFDVRLLDVQQLNDRLMNGEFDVAKTSFHAALMLARETVVLPSGSALGFGVGPLLLSRHENQTPTGFAKTGPGQTGPGAAGRRAIVLCPGETTTATLLYKLFFGGRGNDNGDGLVDLRQVVFSAIMPALHDRSADFGVCIHEGRFTWQQSGLHCVADLGELWETRTGVALPLGGIVARRSLGSETIRTVQAVIRDSIEFGLKNRNATLPTMKKYAAEFEDDVLFSHVDLYVNEQTIELGEVGRTALAKLSELASSVLDSDPSKYSPLEVFS